MGESSGVAAITTLLDVAVGDLPASPRRLTATLAALGLDDDDAAVAAEVVHRAHAEVTRLRRREHELTALFSSARELAEVRDSDALLQRLVGRTHEIMGCDVAYLSVFDPRTRELEVRTTVGAVSSQFQHLHVPAGRGLASEIAETRAPQWISRYRDYPRSRHEAAIDRAVEVEGLVSLLGVPMLADDTVLGVLFVATRRESVFTPEQIALLSALADHASVVLQTAEILRNLRRSEDEARQAVERLTEHLAERDRANTAHQRLVQVVLGGGAFDQIADTLADALSRPVQVLDPDRRVLADSLGTSAGAVRTLPEPIAAALDLSRGSGHCEIVAGDEGVGAVVAITAGSQDLGAVLLGRGEFELGSVDRRTVERAAQVCALLELQLSAVADTERRLQSDLILDILESWKERSSDIERRARSLGVAPTDLDTVHVLAVPGGARQPAVRQLMQLVRRRGLVGEYRGYVTVVGCSICDCPNADALRRALQQRLGVDPLCVTAPTATSPEELGSRFAVAMRTARLLAAIGVTGQAASTDEYLPYAAVFDADPRTLSAFMETTIGPVREYDQQRGTELLATLRAFVRCNASPTRTARALRFHTNTILQRLERLTAILGRDWRDEERLFRISLAVRLDELRTDLVG